MFHTHFTFRSVSFLGPALPPFTSKTIRNLQLPIPTSQSQLVINMKPFTKELREQSALQKSFSFLENFICQNKVNIAKILLDWRSIVHKIKSKVNSSLYFKEIWQGSKWDNLRKTSKKKRILFCLRILVSKLTDMGKGAHSLQKQRKQRCY